MSNEASLRFRDPGGLVLVVAVGLATAAGLVASGGNLAITTAPILLVALVYLVVKAPPRWSATTLAFLLLALELKTDAAGLWATPLVSLGELLSFGLGNVLPINVAGFELLVPLLAGLALWGHRTRAPQHVRLPSATRDLFAVYLAGVLAAEALGLIRGFGPAPWKLRYLLHGPLFLLLFQTAYRNPADFRPLAAAVVLAAHVKALLAAWVQLVAAPSLTGGRLESATNHGDSVLFAMAMLIVIVPALEKPSVRTILRAAGLAALPLWGIILNDRRLAWAMIAMSLVAIFFISPWRPWKRRLVKGLIFGAPVVAAYLWLGWSHSGGFFAPVAQLRSMGDSKDASTYWRDVETWNIATTIRTSPVLGVGLGGEYTEYMFNDSIADAYADYRRWPHNTVLGLLLLTGVFGFAAIWMLYLLAVFLAVRAYRHATNADERSGALLCVAGVICCCVMAWGDTGAHFTQFNLAIGAALALAGKLAVSTGAWPARASGGASVRGP